MESHCGPGGGLGIIWGDLLVSRGPSQTSSLVGERQHQPRRLPWNVAWAECGAAGSRGEASVAGAPEELVGRRDGEPECPRSHGLSSTRQVAWFIQVWKRSQCAEEMEWRNGTPLDGGVTSYKTWYLKELPGGWGLQTRKQAAQRGLSSGAHSPAGGQWPRTISWAHGRKHPTTHVKEDFVSVRRAKGSVWKGTGMTVLRPLRKALFLACGAQVQGDRGEEAKAGEGQVVTAASSQVSSSVTWRKTVSSPSFEKQAIDCFLLSRAFPLTFFSFDTWKQLFVCFSWTKQHWVSRLAFSESTSTERMYFEFSEKAREASEYKIVRVMHISKQENCCQTHLLRVLTEVLRCRFVI